MTADYFDEEKTRLAVEVLGKVLATEYHMRFKTESCHWNIKGKFFHGLHEMYEEQYTRLTEIIDEVAERIRSLKHDAPNNLVKLTQDSELSELSDEYGPMIVATDHEKIVSMLNNLLDQVDPLTEDLLTGIAQDHLKYAWMLRSFAD